MTSTGAAIRAVLFDLDGTLYHQGPLRLSMAAELALAHLVPGRSASTRRAVRVIREFRRAQETLRQAEPGSHRLAEVQLRKAADAGGVDVEVARAIVAEWMFRRPLKYLRWCRRPGLLDALGRLERSGLVLGVLSDYPAMEKLEALGVRSRFSLVLCSTDPDINALKPHPHGYLSACARWGLEPSEVLYVGDRPDVDGVGATAAGVRFACIGRARALTTDAPGHWHRVDHLRELEHLVIH